jgi:hypothetical protein
MMTIKDVMQRLEETFKDYLQQMERDAFVFAEKGRERLRFEIYRTKGDKNFPLKKAAFMILDYGMVWNKDDKTIVDEDELVAGSFITRDDLPLPILALEASMHIGMYDHLNIDLFPVSQDPRFQDTFCKPVQELRTKHENLPGVPPGVITPNLPQGFTSGGMMSGDFDISLRDHTLPWWFAYVELYKNFLDNRDRYPILKEPGIIEEGKKIRDMFLTNFRNATPRIMADIPNLNTEERGKKMGEFLF